MTRIILDTNILMVPGKLGIDIFAELDRICSFSYELCVPTVVIDELNVMTRRKDSVAQNAKLALSLIKAKKPNMLPSKTKDLNADGQILALLDEGDILATVDKQLKERAESAGYGIITVRQERYLMLRR